MNASVRRIACVVLLVLLAGCAASASNVKDEQALQQFSAYAEAPIGHFTYLGRFDDWRALSDTRLVVWTDPTHAYLLSVREPCIHLRFVQRIGVSSTSGTVNNRLDDVLVGDERCQITEIRPVDYKKMRAELRMQKQ